MKGPPSIDLSMVETIPRHSAHPLGGGGSYCQVYSAGLAVEAVLQMDV